MLKGIFWLPLIWFFSMAAGAADLKGVSPDELESLKSAGALVVDLRTAAEWKETGLIQGSTLLTYFDANGQYDQATWLKNLKTAMHSPDQPVVLICRSGNRSGSVGKMLAQQLGFSKVYHLEKGIRGWSAESRILTPY